MLPLSQEDAGNRKDLYIYSVYTSVKDAFDWRKSFAYTAILAAKRSADVVPEQSIVQKQQYIRSFYRCLSKI